MSSQAVIAPSILSADFLHLGDQIAAADASGADWIHVDVMDGHFVPNLTMGPFIVEHCRKATTLPIDVHLMVTEPGGLLQAFAKAGANHLTVHVEACRDIAGTLGTIRSLGCVPGITLSPDTPASDIQPYLSQVGLVLVMTVYPGYSGQEFMPEMLPKIAEVRRMLDEIHSSAWLEVDGGISSQTLPAVLNAGADAFVAAKSVFWNPEGISAGIRTLRGILMGNRHNP